MNSLKKFVFAGRLPDWVRIKTTIFSNHHQAKHGGFKPEVRPSLVMRDICGVWWHNCPLPFAPLGASFLPCDSLWMNTMNRCLTLPVLSRPLAAHCLVRMNRAAGSPLDPPPEAYRSLLLHF
jgi:hypothetical protein